MVHCGSTFLPSCLCIWAVVVALLLTIRSNSLPTLLASVSPLPLEHFPLTPLGFVESGYVSSLALLGDYSLYYDVIEHFQVHFSGVFVGLYENFIWDISGSRAFSLFEWFLWRYSGLFQWMVLRLVHVVVLRLLTPPSFLCVWSIFHTGSCLLWQYIGFHSIKRYVLYVHSGLLFLFYLQW